MRVRDARHPEQLGVIVDPASEHRRDAVSLHGLDYALRWCWVQWQYGTYCWERRSNLLILEKP